jgi:hypothetical protein
LVSGKRTGETVEEGDLKSKEMGKEKRWSGVCAWGSTTTLALQGGGGRPDSA